MLNSKIDKNSVPGNFVSILLLPWSSRMVPRCQTGLVLPRHQNDYPRRSRGAKMVSQGAPGMQKWNPKMPKRAPSSPKGICGEKKHDMLKWMLGCSRGVEMVFRNAEIEDARKIKRGTKAPKWQSRKNKKGPAAEGAAFKIRRTPARGARRD